MNPSPAPMSPPAGSDSNRPADGVHVDLHGISKRYGGVRALSDVGFQIERGTVHALVGENGAGKSTLGRVVAGAVQPDDGSLHVGGRAVKFRSPRDALLLGITLIAQELALMPARSVLDNVFLGFEDRRAGRVDRSRMRERYEALVERVGFHVPPNALVRQLRTADQQKVEILRALARDSELIVMDEPTAALTTDEAQLLLAVVRRLAEDGTTVVFVSHHLKDVLAVSDAVTVMKDGRHVQTTPAGEQTESSLVTAMLGQSIDVVFPDRAVVPEAAPPVLEVRGMSTASGVEDVSLEVRAGEIVGIAGLIGSGRSELLHGIYGADRVLAGAVEVDGAPVRIRSPRDAVAAGVALLPESRKDQGLLMTRSIRENVTLAHLDEIGRGGVLRRPHERRRTQAIAERLRVKTESIDAPVNVLSGGNQQKVLFARCLLDRPRVLLADEPTRGVDVGAKKAIYQLLRDLANEGMGILLVSSELEEVLELSHRVLVMRKGRIVTQLDAADATEDAVMRAAFAAADPSDRSQHP